MSDSDENGRASPTWGMPEQSSPPPQFQQPVPSPQDLGAPPSYGAPPGYGGPPPAYPGAQPKSNKGLIIGLASALGLVVLVGLVLLIVWLSGGFGKSTGRAGGSSVASGTSNSGGLSSDYLVGSWSPNCSGGGSETVTFSADGTARNGRNGQSGTWTLNGNTIEIVAGGRTMHETVTYIDDNTFRSGRDTVHRC